MVNNLQFGIDLGGTKTEIAVLDGNGQVQFGARIPTPSQDYQAILQAIVSLVHQAQLALSVDAQALGVGAPGTPFGAQGRLKNANTTCLIGQALATDLQALLQIPVAVANDANCLVLSEATDGAGADAPVVFGVILGTGVGGGLTVNQKLVNGPNRISGEWGHNPLPHWFTDRHGASPARACYCGQSDCIETYLSGKGLCQTYAELNPGSAVLSDASAIALAATQADLAAMQTLEHYYDALSQALATVINVVDPDVVVFGGGLSQLPGLCDALAQRLPKHVFGGDVYTKLAIAHHGDASGVRGAAWLSQSLSA